MNTLKICFMACLCLNSWCEDTNKIATEDIRVLAVFSRTSEKAGDHVLFSCVGLTITGQVIFQRHYDNRNTKDNFIAGGQNAVNYLNFRITSHSDETMDYAFETCTAGASVIAIGKDGKVKSIFDIPKGVFHKPGSEEYFANIRISSIKELPVNPGNLGEIWSNADRLGAIIQEPAPEVNNPSAK